MYDHKTFFRHDFSKQDLSGKNLSHSKFIGCNFNDSNLTQADCSYSDFTAAQMVKTKCTNTNFANSVLACRFEPIDCYGMTLTLNCKTFTEMRISKKWWFGFVYFALLMRPELDKGKDPRDIIIAAIGSERYLKLKAMFINRNL